MIMIIMVCADHKNHNNQRSINRMKCAFRQAQCDRIGEQGILDVEVIELKNLC
jgi:hypothetical protein